MHVHGRMDRGKPHRTLSQKCFISDGRSANWGAHVTVKARWKNKGGAVDI